MLLPRGKGKWFRIGSVFYSLFPWAHPPHRWDSGSGAEIHSSPAWPGEVPRDSGWLHLTNQQTAKNGVGGSRNGKGPQNNLLSCLTLLYVARDDHWIWQISWDSSEMALLFSSWEIIRTDYGQWLIISLAHSLQGPTNSISLTPSSKAAFLNTNYSRDRQSIKFFCHRPMKLYRYT